MNKLNNLITNITKDNNWFYIVIDFNGDSKYHYNTEQSRDNFKFNKLEVITKDIKFNLTVRFNRVIRKYNNHFYNPDGYKFLKKNNKYQYSSMDDIFYNGIVSKELKYKDLDFVGCLEFSPLISQLKYINKEFPERFDIGCHIHLFVRNSTGLSNKKIMKEFFYKKNKISDNWIENIKRISNIKSKDEVYDLNTFINYHKKQPNLNQRIISK
jgi:hypothetical protein